MTAAEMYQYLRRKWDHVDVLCDKRFPGEPSTWRFFTSNELYSLPRFATRDELYQAGYDFTIAREEEIRQVEEGIDLVTHEYKKATNCGVSMGGASGKALIWQRILACEQAALAALKQGMR